MSAEILPFPQKKKSCWDCRFGYLGQSGVYCTIFNEHIIDESEAEECEAWEL